MFKVPIGTNAMNPVDILVTSPHTNVASGQARYSSPGTYVKTVTVPYYSEYKVTLSQDRGYTHESKIIAVTPSNNSLTSLDKLTQKY